MRARRFLRGLLIRTPLPDRLLFAPPDLRTSEATIATDIYGGVFVLAGRAVSTGGRSPFTIEPPSRGWAESLYGFGWLRHLRAADNAIARSNARALTDDFLSGRWVAGDPASAYRTHVVARRLISFLSQSPMILAGADHAFYRRFVRALTLSVRDLGFRARSEAVPQRRLMAAIALCYAGLCCNGFGKTLRRGTRLLSEELERQILPDGGHASRNPQVLIDLLLELLPLRQTYSSRGVEPPDILVRAISRMLPMVRTFRHGDGALALFNGMGTTAVDHLATLLSYNVAQVQPMMQAPDSGYQRLEAKQALIIADVGAPPSVELSREAHAGCLSVEFSSGQHQIVDNCCTPRGPSESIAQVARSTLAHSTATVAETSSCRFLRVADRRGSRRMARWLLDRLGSVILAGPTKIGVERHEGDGAVSLVAHHDGYAAEFGLVHHRRWRLALDGERLDGEDRFERLSGRSGRDDVVVRFHLHPSLKASLVQNGRVVMLVLPNREVWQFEAQDCAAKLEESIYFAATGNRAPTVQIVLALKADECPTLPWRFERLSNTEGV